METLPRDSVFRDCSFPQLASYLAMEPPNLSHLRLEEGEFSPNLTRFAWRYGISQDENLAKEGRSGLSPIEISDLSAADIKIARGYEKWQRRCLRGFTSRE